ncbi:MAG TPA: amidohydrolase family protein [Gemmatimonadales bacterium]|nr:amidohydrolase family protein [Gemmatimonadales bacterium]
MRLRSILSVLAALPSLVAAQGPRTTVFTNVTVVPMDREQLLPNHTVVIEGQRIIAVGPSSDVRIPQGAVRIEGRGKYLMPGLGEMHAHIPPGQATDADIEKVLAYFALNGVTTVRGMLGAPRHLDYRERAARGELLSPTIYTTGPSFNGNSAPTAEVAIRMVTEQKSAGYDLLKIHPGIRREVYDSIAAAAARFSIRLVGHVPLDVGLERVLHHRQASLDHVDGFLEALVRDGSPVAATQSAFFGANLVGHVDESKLPALVALARASGTWIVPTQTLFESMAGPETPEALAQRPEMKSWPASTVAQWVQATANTRNQLGLTEEQGRQMNLLRRRIMKALYDGGVPFLLGSDAPQWWNVPGFSVERELAAMVRAGFTPYQAYEMGTRNVARFFGAEREFGLVAPGLRADLVLLEANPLDDVANWQRRAGVMVRGKWYDRQDIARRLAELSR